MVIELGRADVVAMDRILVVDLMAAAASSSTTNRRGRLLHDDPQLSELEDDEDEEDEDMTTTQGVDALLNVVLLDGFGFLLARLRAARLDGLSSAPLRRDSVDKPAAAMCA